jgi:exopolysaccharide biosynthesis polyprenyl glycosylphosphotransferase
MRLPLQLSERKALLVLADLAMVTLAVLVALWLWTLRDPWRTFSQDFVLSQAHWFLILIALWLFLAALNNFYDLHVADYLRLSGAALARITALVLLIYLGIYFVAPRHALPRLFILYFGMASFSLVGLWRAGYVLLLSRAAFQRRALIVGAGWAGRTIARTIRNLSPGYHLVGFMDDDPAKQGQVIENLPILGTRRDLVNLVRANDVAEVILAITHDVNGELLQALMDCQEQGMAITPMTALYEELTGRVPVEHIGDAWYIALPLNHAATGGFYPLLKRAVDIGVATLGLVILGLLFPFIALAIVLDSPGPVFYTQERVGKGGKTYRVIKLRTMIPGAEREGEAIWARENDPRVTRVGRFLRKMRLDELPQFINVLRGEMSVVGPRPERPEFVAELERQLPFYRMRHAVKPGMAGWAMLYQDYAGSVEDALVRLQYDLYYIKHQSFWLDMLILLRTLGRMLALRGR